MIHRGGIGTRVEQLRLAIERDAHLDPLARNQDRSTPIIDPAHLIVAHVHLDVLMVGVPVIAAQRDGGDVVLLDEVVLQVVRRGIEQSVLVQAFDFLPHALHGGLEYLIETVRHEQQATALVDATKHDCVLPLAVL